MNEVQNRIARLEEKKWSLQSIADELKAHRNTIGLWKAGKRYPRLDKPILNALDLLLKRNRVPKMRRYLKGSRQREVSK